MNSDENISPSENPVPAELLTYMVKLGKALNASGHVVSAIQTALERAAQAYAVKAEVIVLPTILTVRLGEGPHAPLAMENQTPGLLPLHQVSELYDLLEQVERREVPLDEGVRRIDAILAEPHRFGPAGIVLGNTLFTAGLMLLMAPSLTEIAAAAALGCAVGVLIVLNRRYSHFSLALPVIVATLVSAAVFRAAGHGLAADPGKLLIPPLVFFLPGAIITSAVYELTTANYIAGAGRLLYGTVALFLLFFGIVLGLEVSGAAGIAVPAGPETFVWWAPYLGALVFGTGAWLQLSARTKDMPWLLLVLVIAQFCRQTGTAFFGIYFGVLLAAFAMTLSGTLIRRYFNGPPAIVSSLGAYWFLIPGSYGLVSLTAIFSRSYSRGVEGIIQTFMVIFAISVGILLGGSVSGPALRYRRARHRTGA